MSDLTKQDIEILLKGVDYWKSFNDASRIVNEVLGCTCPVCNPDPVEMIQRVAAKQEELNRRIQEEIKFRNETAEAIQRKLLAMHDSFVADEFFASIPETQHPGKHGL